MTREDEIYEATCGFGLWNVGEAMFKLGAEWADSHPRKGLVDIDKAYEWIADHITEYLDRSDYMAEEFRKAMEE